MTLSVAKSSQFKVNEVVLVTKAGNIEISQMFEELNIYDSVFLPVLSGHILIRDSIGLSGKLLFDGSESLLIDVGKSSGSDIGRFKKAFRIYKQSDRKNDNQNSETFILHFVSDELMYSDQQRINQSYNLTYSGIVEKILLNYLKVPMNNRDGLYEPSYGLRKIVIPNLRPLEAIEWCAKRALDKNQSPNFLFYQNLIGYNFATLSTLLSQSEILDIKFSPKNIQNTNSIDEMSMARDIEVVTQSDTIQKTRSGVNAGKFVGFDPMTKTFATKNISYGDHFLNMKHANENPNISSIQNRDGLKNTEAFDSKKMVNLFGTARQLSAYIKAADPGILTNDENYESFMFQRKALLNNLTAKKLKVVMPGNFQLSSGFNVNVMATDMGIRKKGDPNEDPSINGKYLIVASRHIIKFDKHESILEVATSSSANEFIPTSNPQQTRAILDY